MRKFAIFLFTCVISTTLLTACGGGSSGGAGSFAGTYSGTGTVTVSIPGGPSDSESGTVTVVINPDGSVTVTTGPGEEFKGNISGNTLTANLPASTFNEPGFTCTGTVTANGTASGDTITGTFSGSAVCNGVTFNFSGTFTVTKVASVSRIQSIGLIEQARRGVQ